MSQEIIHTSALEAAHAARRTYPHHADAETDQPIYHTSVLIQAVGVSVLRLLEEREGPFVEVGGPTPKGYSLLDVKELPQPLVITNEDSSVLGIDKVAKAQRLPFKDASIGAIFAAGLPYADYKFYPFGKFDLHKAFIGQAKRCLESCGILAMDTATLADLEYAVGLGFTPVSILETTSTFSLQGNMTKSFWNFIAVNEVPERPLAYTYKAAIKE
jgi:hypothetical protein